MSRAMAELLYNIGVRKAREKYLKKMVKLREKNQLLSLYARCLYDVLMHYEPDFCDKCVHAGICKDKDTIPEECVYRMVTHNAVCLSYLRGDKEVRKAFNKFMGLPNHNASKIDVVGKESFKEYREKEEEFNALVNGSN